MDVLFDLFSRIYGIDIYRPKINEEHKFSQKI
jgi:hypothetical protein